MQITTSKRARYIGDDGWGRPMFKTHSHYYCSVDTLCPTDFVLVDLIERLNQGTEDLYIKTGGANGEPSHIVKGIVVYD